MIIPDNGLENKIATFCLLRVQGKTLMLHRDADLTHFMYGKWTPPGGKFKPEDNNDPVKCVTREYKEETDLELIGLQYRGVVFFDNKNRNFRGKPAKFNFLVHVFEANDYMGNLNPKCDEGSLHWVNDSEIRNLDIEKGDSYIFDLLDKKVPLNHRIILSDADARIELLP